MKKNAVVMVLVLIAAAAAISMFQSWHEKQHAIAEKAADDQAVKELENGQIPKRPVARIPDVSHLKAIPISAPAPMPGEVPVNPGK